MLYLILVGVIVFLAIKLSKAKPVSEQQIIDKVVKRIEDKTRTRTIEPVVVVDRTPFPSIEKTEPQVAPVETPMEVKPTVVEQPIAEEEVIESAEEVAELEKKPLEEVIKGKLRKSRPLTMNEQPMFMKLRETLEPEYVVLSQVSFGAILWTWSYAVRNRFNRKIVDFVICDKGFNVIAVVELDDSSHKGKEERDAERDLILKEAGITVFRYKYTPESSKILEDINSIPRN